MSRRTKVVLILAGLVAFAIILRSSKSASNNPVNNAPTFAVKPQPAAPPTVPIQPIAPTNTSHGSGTPRSKPKRISPSSNTNNDGKSNVRPLLQKELGRVVSIYASWPGVTPKQVLLGQLKQLQPFITNGAIQKIKKEWDNTPFTSKLTVKRVVEVSNLTATPGNQNSAATTVYLTLQRQFKPVFGKPYSQTGIQGYTVNLQIINRQWHVVGIAPQSTPVQTSSTTS